MADSDLPAGSSADTPAAALEIVPFAMLITDASGEALAVNRHWLELSGMSRASSLGSGWLTVLDPEARARLREDAARVAQDKETISGDYQLGGPGFGRWTRWWINAHEGHGPVRLAIAVADVHEDYTRQANLYHLATHDSLTGLLNRSYFVEAADQALRRSERHGRHVGMVFVDLDDFKRVNDIGGHSLGDRVLYAVAGRLRHSVRSADLVARIGGDEFAVLCEDLVTIEEARVVAQRIATALAESVELDGQRWTVAASVGAAIDQDGPESAEDLLDRADRAMYEIKSVRRTEPLPPLTAMAPPGRWGDPEGDRPASTAEAQEPEPVTREEQPAAPPERASGDARQKLLSDIMALRDSLDAIRDRLGQLASMDPSVIDIRERQRASERRE